ncbi:MAG: alpha-E domain-containing protein, partial [Gemmatimonadaceae bacterium]|nr:alpha-E domain-containing protein [Gemmatimonadaceae bacterium]
MAMLCRVAEDVFWMSRYVERAAAVGRLLEVTGHLELDEGDAISRRELWQRLVQPRAGDGALPEALTPASGGLEPLAV